MKHLLIVLALAAAAESAFKPGLRVKFNVGLRPGTDFFFNIPRNVTAAVLDGWVRTQRPDGPLPTLVLYCPTDLILCGYYDDQTGYIAGLQISLAQDNFTDAQFDWATQGYTEWIPSTADGQLIKFWSISQFFHSEEFMSKSVEDRNTSRDESKFLQEDAIWLTGFNRSLDKWSVERSDIESSIFTKQACIPWMGRHFYYNMSSTTPCKSGTIYSWFLLVQCGKVIGIGFLIFGTLPIKENQRNWFEKPSKLAVQVIVPNGPTCLFNLAGSPGAITLHIYFIDKPWYVGCLFQ